jgi:hypothetical protein
LKNENYSKVIIIEDGIDILIDEKELYDEDYK